MCKTFLDYFHSQVIKFLLMPFVFSIVKMENTDSFQEDRARLALVFSLPFMHQIVLECFRRFKTTKINIDTNE